MTNEGNENIKKPITVARAELIGKLADTITSAGLPPIVLEPILKDLYNEMHAALEKQTREDMQRYTEALQNKNVTDKGD